MSKTFGKYNEKDIYSMADSPKTENQSRDYANALHGSGYYPAGLDGCFTVGISGGCGTECWVYLEGKCKEPQEMIPRLETDEEKEEYRLMYGVKEDKQHEIKPSNPNREPTAGQGFCRKHDLTWNILVCADVRTILNNKGCFEMGKNDYVGASLKKIVEQLEWCGYECEGGPLVNNIAFIELKRQAELQDAKSK